MNLTLLQQLGDAIRLQLVDAKGVPVKLDSRAVFKDADTATSPGVVTDYVAENGTSGFRGGIRIRLSLENLDDHTAYSYEGIATRRGGATDLYLFDPASENGIVRFKDMAGEVTKALSDKLEALQSDTDSEPTLGEILRALGVKQND